MRRTLIALPLVVLGMAIGVTAQPVVADRVYHTERLELAPLVALEDGQGQVVNIHANGPVIGALERYQMVGATPSTDYEVWIDFCGAGPFIQTTTLSTDKHGNGHAKAGFSAEDLAPFSGATVEIQWVLRTGGADAYATPCTTVVID